MSFELLECLFAHSPRMAARLSLSQVCRSTRDYIDARWTQLVLPGEMQTVYTMCNPPNVKVFVLTYNSFVPVIKDDDHGLHQWTLSFQRRDKKWHRMYEFGSLERPLFRACIEGLTSADLFGGDDRAHVLVHLFRKQDSRCAVLFDKVIPNVRNPLVNVTHRGGDDVPDSVTEFINDQLLFEFFYDTDRVWIEAIGGWNDTDCPFTDLALYAALHKILDHVH